MAQMSQNLPQPAPNPASLRSLMLRLGQGQGQQAGGGGDVGDDSSPGSSMAMTNIQGIDNPVMDSINAARNAASSQANPFYSLMQKLSALPGKVNVKSLAPGMTADPASLQGLDNPLLKKPPVAPAAGMAPTSGSY